MLSCLYTVHFLVFYSLGNQNLRSCYCFKNQIIKRWYSCDFNLGSLIPKLPFLNAVLLMEFHVMTRWGIAGQNRKDFYYMKSVNIYSLVEVKSVFYVLIITFFMLRLCICVLSLQPCFKCLIKWKFFFFFSLVILSSTHL